MIGNGTPMLPISTILPTRSGWLAASVIAMASTESAQNWVPRPSCNCAMTRSARVLFDFATAIILLENPTGQALVGTATGEHQQRLAALAIPLNKSGIVAGAAVERRVALATYGAQPLGIAEEQLFRILGTEAIVCLPLVTGQRCLGVLIGGVATISGTIMGAMLIALLPRIASELPAFVPFLSSSASEHPNIFEFEQIMYGVLIVAFLLFEPRGLFGIWHRIRTYWKSFPFSY